MKQALAIALIFSGFLGYGCGPRGQAKKPASAPQLTEPLVEAALKDYQPAGLTSTTVGVEKDAVSIMANVADDTDAEAWKAIAKGIVNRLRESLPKELNPIIMTQIYHKKQRVAVGVASRGQGGEEMKFKLDKQ